MFVYSSSLRLSFLQKALLVFSWVYLKQVFSCPLPCRVHRLRTQPHPLPSVPRPTDLLLQVHGHHRHPPLLCGSLRSSSPHVFAISSNCLQSLDRKRQIQCLSRCVLQPFPIRMKITADSCPMLSPPLPRPQQPWAPQQVLPTPVHSTRSGLLCRPGCMLGHRCHLAGNLPGSSSPDPPRLDTVAAPPPSTHTGVKITLWESEVDPLQTWGRPCTALTELTLPLRSPASRQAFPRLQRWGGGVSPESKTLPPGDLAFSPRQPTAGQTAHPHL